MTFPPTQERQRQWMAQWAAAGQALQRQKMAELSSLTDEQACAAVTAVLSLAEVTPLPPGRWTHSDLIEQQRIFLKWHTRHAEDPGCCA